MRLFHKKDKASFRTPTFKNNKLVSGFSIVELIVVLGIFSVIFSVSTTVYGSLQLKNNLDMSVRDVVECLRRAENKSMGVENDLNWGVKITSKQIIIFNGASYAGRNISYDEIINLPAGIKISGMSEIVFDKMTGKTGNIGTIILSNNYGAENIVINSYGTITY